MNATFPRHARVRARSDYARVFENARRTSDPLMSLHWLAAEHPARLGMAVSRKVDTRAVMRNRIKRVLREQVRHIRLQLPPGDYVLVARAAASGAGSAQLRQAFLRLLVRAGALPADAVDGKIAGGTPRVSPPPSSHSLQKPAPDAG